MSAHVIGQRGFCAWCACLHQIKLSAFNVTLFDLMRCAGSWFLLWRYAVWNRLLANPLFVFIRTFWAATPIANMLWRALGAKVGAWQHQLAAFPACYRGSKSALKCNDVRRCANGVLPTCHVHDPFAAGTHMVKELNCC